MRWNRMLMALLAASAVALAGCTEQTDTGDGGGTGGGTGDETQFNTAEITFDANATSPVERTVECPEGDATLTITGEIVTGTVNITVMDGNNSIVWSQNFTSGDNLTLEGETLNGEPGTWTVSVSSDAMAGGQNGTGGGNQTAPGGGNQTDGGQQTGDGQQGGQSTFDGEVEVTLTC